MRLHLSIVCGLAAALVTCAHLRAAEPGASAATAGASADEQAVRQAATDYRAALARKDLEAVDAFWRPEADYVDQIGRVYRTHVALDRARKLFQEDVNLAHLSPKAETVAIRFVTPDVAIEDGDFERAGIDATQSPHGRFTTVWVKHDGKWLIDGIRESPIRAGIATDPLKGLDWLIGDWVAEGPQANVEISCSWAADRCAILARMKIQPKEGKPVEATQLIGWDAGQQRVRSLMFDSRGGFTEGVWTREGDTWAVRTTGTLPDGRRASATKLYSRVDDNTLVWESIDDEVEGQPGLDMRLRAIRKGAKK